MHHPHTFKFAPIAKASGWSIEDGQPQVWWWARFTDHKKLVLSDGTDARQLDAWIRVSIGTATPIGKTPYQNNTEEAKWGYFRFDEGFKQLHVYLFIAKADFDRLLAAVNTAALPSVVVGFGPGYGPPGGAFDSFGTPRLSGPITTGNLADYRWDTTAVVPIEACEISHSRTAPEQSLEMPEQPPESMRVMSTGWAVVTNLLALLIALAMFRAADTKFATAVVGVLLLVYLNGKSSHIALWRGLLQMELAATTRFLKLREVLGVPTSPEVEKVLTVVRERATKPEPAYWINTVSTAIIALIAMYKLLTLLT